MRSRDGRQLALLVGFLVLIVYTLTASSDLLGNGDTSTFRFGTTQAIVDHGHVWLDIAPGSQDLRASRGRDGHYFASYGPGQSVMMIPLYLAGKVYAHHAGVDYVVAEEYATRMLDPILAAGTAALLVMFALALTFSRRTAVLIALVYAFATSAWPDAQSGLEQTAVTFFLLLSIFAAWKWCTDKRRPAALLLLAGTGAGLAFWTRYDALMYLPVLAGYTAWAAGRSGEAAVRAVGLVLAGALPWGAFVLAWDWMAFGNPFDTGSHPDTLSLNPVGNVLGLLVSPGKGLIWYVPVVILLPWCARGFRTRPGGLGALSAAIVTATVVFYGFVAYWHGDPSWGPRYLYPAVPYVALALGEVLDRLPTLRLPARGVVLLLVLVSLGVQVAAVSVTEWRFWYRMEALQQQTYRAAEWTGHPFFWGPNHYQYYWNPRLSPLLYQIGGVYQVARLQFTDDRRYLLAVKPAQFVQTNTALAYPVNTFAFWWLDTHHPPMAPRVRDAALFILFGLLLVDGFLLGREVMFRQTLQSPHSLPAGA